MDNTKYALEDSAIQEFNHSHPTPVLNRLALALSALLHPLLMPTLLFAILLYFSPAVFGIANEAMQWRLLILIFFTTFLIPLLSMLLMFRVRSISSLTLDNKNERFMPFLTTTFFYMVTTFLFMRQMQGYYTMIVVLGSITFSIALVTLITVYWKISAHSVGICGVIGFLFGFYQKYADPMLFYPILAIILLAGLLMSARLYLNSHTPAQVFAGSLLGLIINFATVYFLI
jgi:membrane-associated phospholipid phosphatase